MASLHSPITAKSLAEALGALVVGRQDLLIETVEPVSSAVTGSVTLVSNKKFLARLPKQEGIAVVTKSALVNPSLPFTYLVVEDPQRALSRFLGQHPLFERPPIAIEKPVHPTATVGEQVRLGNHIHLGARVSVGDRTIIYDRVYVGEGVRIGSECTLFPGACLMDGVIVGDRVSIGANSVVGGEGFGFMAGEAGFEPIPQVGTVRIENDVTIGANCTIDRATYGETLIGQGTKIDNLVHIGHNCRVGRHCAIAAQVGLAGSVIVEDGVLMGGQVGVGQGLIIRKGARLGGQTGVTANLKAGETYFLTPATPMAQVPHIVKYLRKLPEIWKRLKAVEEGLGELKS